MRKVQRKDHSAADVDQVITWLTGYDAAGLQRTIADEVDLETFFAQAPRTNPHASLITGVICGLRVEEIEDPLMQQIRYMDKLVDEVARPATRALEAAGHRTIEDLDGASERELLALHGVGPGCW